MNTFFICLIIQCSLKPFIFYDFKADYTTSTLFSFLKLLYSFFSFKISKNSSWLIILSLIELLISISIQFNLFLAEYNNLLCFFFLNFDSCCNFIVIPKDKESNKLNIDVINPNNFFFFLTCAKILVDEKTVKNTVKISFKMSKIVKYLLSLLVKDC